MKSRTLIALIGFNPHHRAPSGWLLLVIVLLVLLYVAFRTGRLGKLSNALRDGRVRGPKRRLQVSPLALLPTAVLVIVIVVLLLTHG